MQRQNTRRLRTEWWHAFPQSLQIILFATAVQVSLTYYILEEHGPTITALVFHPKIFWSCYKKYFVLCVYVRSAAFRKSFHVL
jgi:hypothetical protein